MKRPNLPPATEAVMQEMHATQSREIEARVRRDCLTDTNGCLLWQCSAVGAGYGQVHFGRRLWRTHRLMFVAVNGAIPQGLAVCHRCNVRRCCNPAHLYAGTQKQNIADMVRAGRGRNVLFEKNASKTHCVRGHPLSGDNLVLRRNKKRNAQVRTCRECYRMWTRVWETKRKPRNKSAQLSARSAA